MGIRLRSQNLDAVMERLDADSPRLAGLFGKANELDWLETRILQVTGAILQESGGTDSVDWSEYKDYSDKQLEEEMCESRGQLTFLPSG